MKLFPLMIVLLALCGCAGPPQLTTNLHIEKSPDHSLVVLNLTVTNLDDSATVPIAVELTGQAHEDGAWSKPEVLLHPAAFVLNRKEQRGMTKAWRIQADAVRTTLTIKEQESGHVLKTEQTVKDFSGSAGS